jgi:tyrosinase
MSGSRKSRKSVPISETVAVNTREVNVAVEGLDPSAISSSFAVHLLKDGQRIASRFFFQPSGGANASQPGLPPEPAHFDFLLPIDAVADGKLSVEIEPTGSTRPEQRPQPERMGRPTLRVYLMLESD